MSLLQDKYLQGRAHRLRCILREASVVVDAMAVGASNTSGMAGIPSEALISRGVEQPASWAFSLPSSTHAGGHAARVLLQPPSLKQFVRSLDEKVINAMQVRTRMITLVLSKAPRSHKASYLFPC